MAAADSRRFLRRLHRPRHRRRRTTITRASTLIAGQNEATATDSEILTQFRRLPLPWAVQTPSPSSRRTHGRMQQDRPRPSTRRPAQANAPVQTPEIARRALSEDQVLAAHPHPRRAVCAECRRHTLMHILPVSPHLRHKRNPTGHHGATPCPPPRAAAACHQLPTLALRVHHHFHKAQPTQHRHPRLSAGNRVMTVILRPCCPARV